MRYILDNLFALGLHNLGGLVISKNYQIRLFDWSCDFALLSYIKMIKYGHVVGFLGIIWRPCNWPLDLFYFWSWAPLSMTTSYKVGDSSSSFCASFFFFLFFSFRKKKKKKKRPTKPTSNVLRTKKMCPLRGEAGSLKHKTLLHEKQHQPKSTMDNSLDPPSQGLPPHYLPRTTPRPSNSQSRAWAT